MKLPQNPILRQVHRFRESLLLLLYYSLSFWACGGCARGIRVWRRCGLWVCG